MYGRMQKHLSQTLAEIKEAGLYKEERLIESSQQATITVKGKEVLNFCANNYLGLADSPRLIEAAPPDQSLARDDGPPRIRDVVRPFHLRHARHT